MKNLFSIATKILVASGGFIAFFSMYVSLQAAPNIISENKNVAPKASATELTSTETPPSLGASGVPNPVCLDNYQSLPNSNTFKADAPWSTAFIVAEKNTNMASNTTNTVANPLERDLNGDGLVDYLYVNHLYNSSYGYNSMQDCVYLNNGSGWTLAYRCYAAIVNGAPKFYGDCAEVGN